MSALNSHSHYRKHKETIGRKSCTQPHSAPQAKALCVSEQTKCFKHNILQGVVCVVGLWDINQYREHKRQLFIELRQHWNVYFISLGG